MRSRPDNIAGEFSQVGYGEIDQRIRRCRPRLSKRSCFIHRGAGHPMECRAMLAAHDTRERHADALGQHAGAASTAGCVLPHDRGWPMTSVRIICARYRRRLRVSKVHGLSGTYGDRRPAAIETRSRPVKYIEDRREHFLATHQDRDQLWNIEIAVDARRQRYSGRARHACCTTAAPICPGESSRPSYRRSTMPGPYVVPELSDSKVTCVFTNKVATTPVRGAGRPHAIFAMERLMDRVALRARFGSGRGAAAKLHVPPEKRCPIRSASPFATAVR